MVDGDGLADLVGTLPWAIGDRLREVLPLHQRDRTVRSAQRHLGRIREPPPLEHRCEARRSGDEVGGHAIGQGTHRLVILLTPRRPAGHERRDRIVEVDRFADPEQCRERSLNLLS